MPARLHDTNTQPALYHEKRGTGRKVILLVHGFGLNRKSWYDIADSLAEHATIYMIDLIGSGDSPAPENFPYTFESQADALLDFIRDQAFSDLSVIGHSYGGGVCLMLLHKMAQKGLQGMVRRLVLIAPAAFPQPLPFFMAIPAIPFLGEALLKLISHRVQIKMTLMHVMYNKKAVTQERVMRYTGNLSKPAWRKALIHTASHALNHETDRVPEKISAIRTPSLLIYGDKDIVISRQNLERLSRTLPDVETHVIKDCGHIPHEEHPGRVTGRITDFLSLE